MLIYLIIISHAVFKSLDSWSIQAAGIYDPMISVRGFYTILLKDIWLKSACFVHSLLWNEE